MALIGNYLLERGLYQVLEEIRTIPNAIEIEPALATYTQGGTPEWPTDGTIDYPADRTLE